MPSAQQRLERHQRKRLTCLMTEEIKNGTGGTHKDEEAIEEQTIEEAIITRYGVDTQSGSGKKFRGQKTVERRRKIGQICNARIVGKNAEVAGKIDDCQIIIARGFCCNFRKDGGNAGICRGVHIDPKRCCMK